MGGSRNYATSAGEYSGNYCCPNWPSEVISREPLPRAIVFGSELVGVLAGVVGLSIRGSTYVLRE